MRDTTERDIYEAIIRIEKYTRPGRTPFDHVYFGIDRDIVWAVVERDIPHLKSSIEAILAEDK